ncbi:hypothetical protein EDB83DRAFT_2447384 [Lactarius deliciosus]|nr:hypothetical protein EDB83DRAFT_2447384 [Lactarius deliciosus]
MYLEMATEEDKMKVERWKAGADGIFIITGLFSAAVASLISVFIQDIRPNPQDTSNLYLANIYQTLTDPALVISISCALLATLLRQWARRYLKVIRPPYSLHKRARIRSFFVGVDTF